MLVKPFRSAADSVNLSFRQLGSTFKPEGAEEVRGTNLPMVFLLDFHDKAVFEMVLGRKSAIF